MNTLSSVPIIDLFAGPGGLGEGFSSLTLKDGESAFKIALSIEKDAFAHQTLTLRNFLRKFDRRSLPQEYYDALRLGSSNFEELYLKYPKEANAARLEAWRFELGNVGNHKLVDKRIRESLVGHDDFVLIGGPPCQAYSIAGRARRQEANGLNKEDIRVYLYREYYRILAVHKPSIFVMENVKGILSSKVDNQFIFRQLLSDLENPVASYRKLKGHESIGKVDTKYRIYSMVKKATSFDLISGSPIINQSDFIIESEKYGIPQTRHRVILLGIRDDIEVVPDILKPASNFIPLKQVISKLPKIRSGLSKEPDGKKEWYNAIHELLSTKIFKDLESDLGREIESMLKSLRMFHNGKGKQYISGKSTAEYQPNWFFDKKLGGVINHESRSHIKEDLHRYFFAACFAKLKKYSPMLSEFPKILLPNHVNLKNGLEDKKFADRFRVQVLDKPSKTITSHISKDGNYYIHPDPLQCRTLTVREAARIQTFPDNYYFCGPRTEQFHQVGNAVPPLLAVQIAKIVLDLVYKIRCANK